jgi:hypothetical protein
MEKYKKLLEKGDVKGAMSAYIADIDIQYKLGVISHSQYQKKMSELTSLLISGSPTNIFVGKVTFVVKTKGGDPVKQVENWLKTKFAFTDAELDEIMIKSRDYTTMKFALSKCGDFFSNAKTIKL